MHSNCLLTLAVLIYVSIEPEAGHSPGGAGSVDKEPGLLAKTHHSHGVCNR